MGHRIEDEEHALVAARDFAEKLAIEAADRDRERRLAADELAQLSETGLLAITVPRRYGGADVSTATVTEVFRLLATADASVAQIPQSHVVFLEVLRLQGTDEQQRRYFAEALRGARFANAQSERATRTIAEDATTLTRSGDGYLLQGEKFYSTGALFADWLAVRASSPDEPVLPNGLPRKAIAYIRHDAPGVEIVDDWTGMGQRTTASGTVRLDHVAVRADEVVPFTPIFDQPATYGAQAQILHAAIDAGIARAAVSEAAAQIGRARAWFEAGVDTAAEDPLLIQQAGELEIEVRAAEALLAAAAREIDTARARTSADSVAEASIATAAAKVACARAAVTASSALFELSGTRSAAEGLNLSRLWRDARTHTLHDPSRWKVQHIGRWTVSRTAPPRHGLL